MKISTHFRVLGAAATLLTGVSANAAGVLGTTAVGSLTFDSDPANYFDPANGYVPSDYSNSVSNAVVLADPAKDFGFDDGDNLDAADFTDTQLYISDTPEASNTNAPWTMTFIDPAFTSISLVSSSFTPDFTYGIIGDTLVFNYAGGLASDPQVAVFDLNGVSAVPEPQTYALLAAGLLTVGFAARRHSKR